jgi:hypothetical protein
MGSHTGATTSSGSTTTPAPAPTTAAPATSNGGFLDFIVAIAALVMMLNAHKFIKELLDHLFPGGGKGRGPGAIMSGLMEGVGMEAGMMAFKKGTGAMKAGAGVMAAGGIGGLASAMKYAKDAGGLIGKDGLVGGMFNRATKSAGGNQLGLYPPGLPSGPDTADPTGFTMNDPDSGGGMSFGPGTPSEESGTATGGGTGGMGSTSAGVGGIGVVGSVSRAGTSGTGASTSGGLFDGASKRNGAATQLRPSAQSKLSELSNAKQKGTVGGMAAAFVGGAASRAWGDIKHKAAGGKGYAGTGQNADGKPNAGARNILGVAAQEFGGMKNHGAENQVNRDAFVPNKHLMKAADSNDPMAAEDMGRIGTHQSQMEEGAKWMEQGYALQRAIQPDYEAAQTNYDSVSHEVAALDIAKRGYEAQGLTNTPEYQAVAEQHEMAFNRQGAAKITLDNRQKQWDSATNMVHSGDRRMHQSQDAISKINWSWTPEQQRSAPRMMKAAQARAQRKTLSDLGQPPNRQSKRG